jgi:hypothetical protein
MKLKRVLSCSKAVFLPSVLSPINTIHSLIAFSFGIYSDIFTSVRLESHTSFSGICNYKLWVTAFLSQKVQVYDREVCASRGTYRRTVWPRYVRNGLHLVTLGYTDICTYFYSKTNQIHNISNLFYIGTTLYIFRTIPPSIIRSLRLYIQHQVYVIQVLWLFASGKEMENVVPAATEPLWHIPDAVCTALDSWWWTERPSETCTMLFQNKINLSYCESGWFYYRNILRCTVLQTSENISARL